MDTLYIGDIPEEYHFARFGSDYIDLFNTDTIVGNRDYTYYRVYMYDNLFADSEGADPLDCSVGFPSHLQA